jgi:hypothetical protein
MRGGSSIVGGLWRAASGARDIGRTRARANATEDAARDADDSPVAVHGPLAMAAVAGPRADENAVVFRRNAGA